jgi:flagellar basal-body rod protein FlgC
MVDSYMSAMSVAASGMRAQSVRVRVAAENLSNAESADYKRKIVTFGIDNEQGDDADHVTVERIRKDMSEAKMVYDPTHPLADTKGYVKLSNVNPLIEAMDAKEAQRSYEASLSMFDQARSMYQRTLEMLRR